MTKQKIIEELKKIRPEAEEIARNGFPSVGNIYPCMAGVMTHKIEKLIQKIESEL